MNLVALPLTKIKLFSSNELTYPFLTSLSTIMARTKSVPRGKAAATISDQENVNVFRNEVDDFCKNVKDLYKMADNDKMER